MSNDEALSQDLEKAVEAEMSGAVAAFRPKAAPPSLADQFQIYEKCGAELRRRITEERSALVAAYERRVSAYQEEVRGQMARMKSDLEARLREHELLAGRLL